MNKVGMIIIGALALFIVALAIYNGNEGGDQDNSGTAWNKQMTLGDEAAPHTFVAYTDVTCPYCAAFHTTAFDGALKEDYIDSGKVRMETRVTSLLSNVNSVRAGETAYCAADQGKFFDYYDTIVRKFKEDYFDKGIGISPTSPRVPKLEDDYYLSTAKESGLDDKLMESCLADGKMVREVDVATRKAINMGVTGVPAFSVNSGKYVGSGFGGGYETIEQMLRAGGVE